jgi:hypothetical protein
MNEHEMFQLVISILILGFFLGYALHLLSYIYGIRSEIDERLRRYAGTTEQSGGMR